MQKPVPVPLITELCQLVDSGCLARVSAFLLAHPDLPLNAPGERMVSPLQLASGCPSSLAIVRVLLSRGASPHYAVPGLDATALHAACAADSGHTAALLLAAGADPLRADALGRTALHWAALHASGTLMRRIMRAVLHRVCAVAAACDKAGWLAGEAAPHATLAAAVGLVTRDCVSGNPLHAILGSVSTGAPGAGGARGGGLSAGLGGGGGPSAFTAAGARGGGGGGGGEGGSGAAAARARTLAPDAFRAAVSEAFRALLNGQDASGYSAAMLAAEHGKEDAVKVLLGAGADAALRNKLSHSAAEVRLLAPILFQPPSPLHTRAPAQRIALPPSAPPPNS